MKITVFTSNQPRHLSLVKKLSQLGGTVYAIQECNTVFPGKIKDFFNNSEVMQQYFSKVMEAEKKIFGNVGFLPENVRQLALKSGDISYMDMSTLKPALDSDIYIVFGASFIRGELIDFLIDKKAVNIHMGVSPYYRGSSCNFWAPYDGRPELIGATVHLLSKGLDSGPMLYHALPAPIELDCFTLGMKAVEVAHDSLVSRIKSGELMSYDGVEQDKNLEMRYTRNIDFNDDVAREYLGNMLTPKQVYNLLANRDMSMFTNPFLS